MVTRKTYEHLPKITGPYVHATQRHDTLYVSGLTAWGTEAQSSELEPQARAVLHQLAAILHQEERNKSDFIKLTIFVKDISQLSLIRAVLFEFYEGQLPACSMVEVSGLIHPDLLIEIEAIISLE